MLEGLSSLLDKSLLNQEHESSGETRFGMLYVLREFGLEQLEAEGEGTATREAHAAYYLALAVEQGSPDSEFETVDLFVLASHLFFIGLTPG